MGTSNNIVDKMLERSQFFREVQALPLAEEFNFKGWLGNFKDTEREIASMILDFFVFYPKNMVNRMLITSVGRAGYELAQSFSDWKHSDFKNRCYYSFIPGETPNSSDSGYYFIRKLRDELNIPENRFIDYSNLHHLLESAPVQIPIILVDDFVGSGAQCHTAWSQNRRGVSNSTLEELSIAHGHKIVYAPLLVNMMGFNLINSHCKGLVLSPAHILGEEYNLFSENCFCWEGDYKKYIAGTDLILSKSRELGIPSTNGRDVNDERGFGAQGLAVAFEHGAPDAIPAFFYWETGNWVPLIKKNYTR